MKRSCIIVALFVLATHFQSHANFALSAGFDLGAGKQIYFPVTSLSLYSVNERRIHGISLEYFHRDVRGGGFDGSGL